LRAAEKVLVGLTARLGRPVGWSTDGSLGDEAFILPIGRKALSVLHAPTRLESLISHAHFNFNLNLNVNVNEEPYRMDILAAQIYKSPWP